MQHYQERRVQTQMPLPIAAAVWPLPLYRCRLRYMHTTVEMVHREDVENVIKLIYESLLKIKHGGDAFSYFE